MREPRTAMTTTAPDAVLARAVPVASEPRRNLVRDVMTTEILSVRPEYRLDEINRTLRDNFVRAVPVLDAQGTFLGAVFAADLSSANRPPDPRDSVSRGRRNRGGGAWDRPDIARALMRSPVGAVAPTASLAEAARAMRDYGSGWLAVVEPLGRGEHRLVGVLGRSDLIGEPPRDDAHPYPGLPAPAGRARQTRSGGPR